ncbi:MAG: neutral/alkaline non-lysosomal ceramidase N-terminal domain-containing protein, partial [Candidatus Hydrogenedentota bacterium]
PLGGYGERENAPAVGVHDNTMAKALILKQGDKKFALVTLDLLGVPRSLRDEILKRLDGTGIGSDNLLLAASHSHASVEMNAMNRNNVFQNKNIGIYDEFLLMYNADKIAEVIINANKSFEPISVGTASTIVPGLNANRRGNERTDEEMVILRLDDAQGNPKVVFINYAAHPTFMGSETMQVSAGWPGYLQREVEGFLGKGVMCMYANGAQGDLRPTGAAGPSEFARAEDYGRKLAVYALELVPLIETKSKVDFKYAMHTLELPERTPPKALLDSAGPEYGLTPDNIQALIEALVPESSYISTLQLGDFTAVSTPGEMTTILGLEVKNTLKKAGAKHAIIVGLGNEWISYILSPEEMYQGGYEPGVSFYGDQFGPTVVKQMIAAGMDILK